MHELDSFTPIDAEAKNARASNRLFFLDFSAGRILPANPDGRCLIRVRRLRAGVNKSGRQPRDAESRRGEAVEPG